MTLLHRAMLVLYEETFSLDFHEHTECHKLWPSPYNRSLPASASKGLVRVHGCCVWHHGSRQAVTVLEQWLRAYILIHKHEAERETQNMASLLKPQSLPTMTHSLQDHTS